MNSIRLVQPFSLGLALAASLVACGGAAPTPLVVVSTVPSSIATNVPVESNVSATFSSVLDPSTFTATTFFLSPSVGGTIQVQGAVATFKHATALQPNTQYTVKLARSIADANGNELAADHLWEFTTGAIPDSIPPAKVTTLAATGPTSTTVDLTWTAVGDNGQFGTAASYTLRSASGSSCPLTANNFASATLITTGAPQATGSAEALTVTGLNSNTTYCFGLTVTDAAGNVSALSNIATAKTLP